MNLGEKLRRIITENIDSAKPFFAIVVKQNDDFTWQVQPIDEQPLIYSAQTFQEVEDGNKPAVGSLVLCIYIDQFSCFITEIIDYDSWYVNANNSVILGSEDISIASGKRVIINSSEKNTQDLKQIIEEDNFGGEQERFLYVISKGAVQIASNETFDQNDNVSFIRLNNQNDFNDNIGMLLNNYTSLGTQIMSRNLMVIEGENDIDIRSDRDLNLVGTTGVKITSNNVELNVVLEQMMLALEAINTALGGGLPTIPTARSTFNLYKG